MIEPHIAALAQQLSLAHGWAQSDPWTAVAMEARRRLLGDARPPIEFFGCTITPDGVVNWTNGQAELTCAQGKIMYLLASNPGFTVPYHLIRRAVDVELTNESLSVYIYRIRQSLRGSGILIKNNRLIGYKLVKE